MTLEQVPGGFQPHTKDRMVPWLPHVCAMWVSCGDGAWAVHGVECSLREAAGGCNGMQRGGRDGDPIPRPCSEQPEIPPWCFNIRRAMGTTMGR